MVFKAKVRNLLTLFDTGGLKQPPLIGFLLVPEKNKWEVFSILLLSWIWIWRCLNHFFRPHFTFGGQETNKKRHFPLFMRRNSVQGSKSTKKATKIGTPFMVITSITPISNVTGLKKTEFVKESWWTFLSGTKASIYLGVKWEPHYCLIGAGTLESRFW